MIRDLPKTREEQLEYSRRLSERMRSDEPRRAYDNTIDMNSKDIRTRLNYETDPITRAAYEAVLRARGS